MKLHLGCGGVVLPGYLNIDSHVEGRPAEVFKDDAATLKNFAEKYPNAEVEEIISFHLFEHMPRPGAHCHNAETALKTWFNVLRPGGTLIIECPNFEEVVKEYVGGNKDRINNIFGLHRFPGDVHQWGYTPDSIRPLLEANGFYVVSVGPGTDYHAKLEPCMRVEAMKTWNSFRSNVVI